MCQYKQTQKICVRWKSGQYTSEVEDGASVTYDFEQKNLCQIFPFVEIFNLWSFPSVSVVFSLYCFVVFCVFHLCEMTKWNMSI